MCAQPACRPRSRTAHTLIIARSLADWDPISEKAKDFVRKMLTVDPKQRLTVDQCLEHEWLKDEAGKNQHLLQMETKGTGTSTVEKLPESTAALKQMKGAFLAAWAVEGLSTARGSGD